MGVNYQWIARAKALVAQDERGYYTSTSFDKLFSPLRTNVALHGTSKDARIEKILTRLKFIDQDFRNLVTLAGKVEWLWSQHLAGSLDESKASRYMTTDIDMFHVEFRSLFDYVAALVHIIAVAPSEVSANNFGSLIGLVEAKDKRRVRPALGPDLADLLLTCDWFTRLQLVRDAGVHQGGFAIVFPAQQGIDQVAFQTYEQNGNPLIDLPEVMFNRQVVFFSGYAAVHIAYLALFLDQLATIVLPRLTLQQVDNEPRSYHPDWATVLAQYDQLIQKSEGK